MGQIHERQRRALTLENAQRAATDPAGGLDVGRGSPEAEQRELPQLALQFVAKLRRMRVDIGQLATVGRIHGARRYRKIGRRVHVVPPEELGAGERRVATLRCIPELLAADQVIGLAPKPDFREVAEIPAVANDAVLARRRPGDEGRLHRGGDCGRDGRQRAHRAARCKRFQVRRVREQRWCESDDVENERALHERSMRLYRGRPDLEEQAGGQVAVHPEIVTTGTITVSVNLANGAWMRCTVSMSGASSSV